MTDQHTPDPAEKAFRARRARRSKRPAAPPLPTAPLPVLEQEALAQSALDAARQATPPAGERPRSPAQERRRSRYTRPRTYFSPVALVIGLVIGLGGALYYAWNIDQPQEFDTAPWQLRQPDRQAYLVAIMISHAYRGDLAETIDQLIALDLPGADPIQQVAEVACDLARSGYVNSSSGLRAIRRMMTFYQQQGKSGCADALIPLTDDTTQPVLELTPPTATLLPPASKTPTPLPPVLPTPTPPTAVVLLPTTAPTTSFTIVDGPRSFCSAEASGVIEVRVQDFEGQGIPGQPVRVRWDAGESTFFTGLKPERGPAYADFEMEAGRSYVVEMPGLSDPSRVPMTADPCFTESGEQVLTSYRVVFREN